MVAMKKVVFVGGTSYSGSTFFQLTLANDPHGFACGEVRPLFYPAKQRHLQRVCGCGDPNCTVWQRIKKGGEERLYQSIFEMFPEVDFILESSKNVHWTHEQSERLQKQGIETAHVLIAKTPLEYVHSLRKRNRLEEIPGWPRYHRLYYSLIDDWRAVQYHQYTQEQQRVLQRTCEYLGIPYFEGKERFWEKQHHSLGGNLSARVHLYSKDSANYQDIKQRKARTRHEDANGDQNNEKYRQVYYEKPDDPELQALVARMKAESPEVAQIEKMLQSFDIFADSVRQRDWPELRVSPQAMRLKRLRLTMRDQISKYKLALASRGG